MRFIFMLTKNDVTIPDALKVFRKVGSSGVANFGFKDIGLPRGQLKKLVRMMHARGAEVFLEVVSESSEACVASANSAMGLGVDYLIGGVHPEPVMPLIKGTGIKFFPYVGRVVGHPCALRGTISEIVDDAKRVESLGVDGINLLAYRYDGDARSLMKRLIASVDVPVIVAGSIDSAKRIEEVAECGAWGFTIGGAILEKKFAPGKDLESQIQTVLGSRSLSPAQSIAGSQRIKGRAGETRTIE